MRFGPWTSCGLLTSNGHSQLYEVREGAWIVKALPPDKSSLYELDVVLRLATKPPSWGIALPVSPYFLFGNAPDVIWYAMRLYGGDVHGSRNSARAGRIAECVLGFLGDLHLNHRLVHMDIKLANILVDDANDGFRVCDYGLSDVVRPEVLTRDLPDSTSWYLLGQGAEPDKPPYSWRMDLVALGYALADLLDEKRSMEFPNLFERRRTESGQSTEELLALRNREMGSCAPILRQYFRELEALPWNAVEPPSRSFYENLTALFLTWDSHVTVLIPEPEKVLGQNTQS